MTWYGCSITVPREMNVAGVAMLFHDFFDTQETVFPAHIPSR